MCLNMVWLHKQKMYVACGQCIECKVAKSREWSNRIALEAMEHDENSFITLTYDTKYIPENNSLRRKDLQDFIKRLRRRFDYLKIRYFYCGEYGSQGLRPHYHMILFGFDFPDKKFFQYDHRGNPLYRSNVLEDLWPFGFSSIGYVTPRTCLYVAKYLQKLPKSIEIVVPPFAGMSLKPGIAYSCINNKIIANGCLYINGKQTSIPRYFLKVLERDYPDQVAALKKKWIDMDHAGFKVDLETGEAAYYPNLSLPDNFMDQALMRRHSIEKKYGILLDEKGRLC